MRETATSSAIPTPHVVYQQEASARTATFADNYLHLAHNQIMNKDHTLGQFLTTAGVPCDRSSSLGWLITDHFCR